MGSDNDNYIDAAYGKDYVLGLKGNDTIKLYLKVSLMVVRA